MLVIATNNLQTLRFFSPSQLPPFAEPTAKFIAAQDFWETLDPWSSPLAPGGSLAPALRKLANGWAWYHSYISKIPNFLLLTISGFLANIVIGWVRCSFPLALVAPPTSPPSAFLSQADRFRPSLTVPQPREEGQEGCRGEGEGREGQVSSSIDSGRLKDRRTDLVDSTGCTRKRWTRCLSRPPRRRSARRL